MTDLERRALIHLLDGQAVTLAVLVQPASPLTVAATDDWLTEARVLRAELEDEFVDEPIPFTLDPGVN